ncbi:MAG TPA: hypothetical protein VN851_04865, partial [Thermoanaerobaculia bacterium]|nr:hypothetical protein [Thermoanaerobaculia bacterium]
MQDSDRRSLLPILSAVVLLALAAESASAAEVERIVSFEAGLPGPCQDGDPDVAVQPGGSFLLTWRSDCAFVSSSNRALRFDAAGRPIGASVELWGGVGTVAAPLPNGGFVASSWFERDVSPFFGINLHRLDPLGRPLGGLIPVAADPSDFSPNIRPRLAVAPNGSVAVVWIQSTFDPDFPGTVLGRFYDASLEPVTEAFSLSLEPPIDRSQIDPDVAFGDDGTALAVWTQLDGGSSQILGRLFTASGQPLGAAFPISQPDHDRPQGTPRVAARSGGGWWVAWQGFGGDGVHRASRVVRLSAAGEPVGYEQPLGLPAEMPGAPALGTDATGNLLLLATVLDGSIAGRPFDAQGAPVSGPVEISGSERTTYRAPALAGRSPAGFVAAWAGQFLPSSDADLFGAVLARTCLPAGNAACLGPGGRFAVDVSWRTAAGSGIAKPLPLAAGAATFGLQDAANQDVAVVLSGPDSNDLTFTATTGAAIDVRITDRTSGATRTVSKPAGRFASQRVPHVLPISPLGANGALASSAGEIPSPEDAQAATGPAPTLGGTCLPSSRTLCLLGGRFRAEVFGPGSHPPRALALARTDRSGAFAFPAA